MEDNQLLEARKHRLWMTPANILLISGSSFIIIAIFVLIFASWNSFSPIGRVATTVIPLIALYSLGFATRQKPDRSELAVYTILTGSVIFPFVLGVLINQLNLMAYPSSLFYFYLFFVTTVWYIILEFVLRQKTHAFLTVVSAIGLVSSYSAAINAESFVYCLMAVLLSVFFLSVAWHADQNGEHFQAKTYSNAGVILGWTGLMLLPWTYFGFIFSSAVTLEYAAIAVLFFGIAILYSKEWQTRKSEQALQIRQIAEVSSALALLVPAIIAALFHGNDTLNALLALILGVLSCLVSSFVRVYLFRILGWTAAAIGLFELIFFAFNQLKAEWPIALLLLGFILIGSAYGFQHFKYRELFQKFVNQPDSSMFDLGLQPVRQPVAVTEGQQLARAASTVWDPSVRPPRDPALLIVLGVIGIVVLLFVYGAVFH